MKKWAFAFTVAFFAAVSVAAGAVALTDEGGARSGARLARDADGSGESGGQNVAPVCAPDVPNCDDMIVNPDGAAGICLEGAVDCIDAPSEKPAEGDACIEAFPTPPECADPDAPVTNEPQPSDEQPPSDLPADACTMEYPNECTATNAAIADLAVRLDVKEDAITVVSVERVDWPDSCLGIDKTDMACAEMITPGFRIILEANSQAYEYHTDGFSRAELVE